MSEKIDRIRTLLKMVENYQDIELPDGSVIPGKRKVDERYSFIKPYIRDGLYFDFGSNFGGFSRRIARDFKSVVVSFEANPISNEIQKILLELHDIKNVILIGTPFGPDLIKRILNPVELVDGFLFMSILHHFSHLDSAEMLNVACYNVPDVFVELPSDSDKIACGNQSTRFLNELLPKFNFGEIGRASSHTGETRVTSLRRRDEVTREGTSYYGTARTIFKKKYQFKDGNWSIDDIGGRKPFIGVNLWNVIRLGEVLYPSGEVLANMACEAYEALINKEPYVEDVRPWNLIFTPDGMRAIDYTDRMNGGNDLTLRELRESIIQRKSMWDLASW